LDPEPSFVAVDSGNSIQRGDAQPTTACDYDQECNEGAPRKIHVRSLSSGSQT
jgi:hypothetical protein